LIVNGGGKTRVLDLDEAIVLARKNGTTRDVTLNPAPSEPPTPPQDPPADEAAQRARALESAKQSAAAALPTLAAPRQAADFFSELVITIPPGSKNPITIIPLVERDNDDPANQGLLAIDSIDIVIVEPESAPAPAQPSDP
jgi:hypothetical protein